jgi:hypothetical protein
MAIDFLFRRETADEYKVAADAAHFDSVDMIEGPDGMLGIVALHHGRRVCQQCGKGFNASDPRMRMTPVYLEQGAPCVYLHAKCETPPARIFTMFRGLKTRREVANVVKLSAGLDKAASDTDTGIIP